MHATSLQALVMLVAQAAPGGQFQPTTDKVDVPPLLVPSAQDAPDKNEPDQDNPTLTFPAEVTPAQVVPARAVPPRLSAPTDLVDEPESTLPKNRGSQFTPPDFVPLDSNPKPTSVLNTAPPARPENVENPKTDARDVRAVPGPPVEFSSTDEVERTELPLRSSHSRVLAVGPNRAPWDETKKLITQAVTLPANSPGQQTSLRDALARISDRNERIAVIKTYWQLSVATADLNHAQDEARQLATLPEPLDEVEQSQLSAAVTTAAARLSETKLVLLSTQHELAELMKSGNSTLPLTNDVPFVGTYQPRFEQIFAGRPAPANLRKLAESLPLYLDLANARANSVLSAEVALEKIASSYPRGSVTYSQVLDAFQNLRDQRIAFLATVRDYNSAIADYSLNTVHVGLNTDAIVATLIETEPVPSVLVSPSGVRPATAIAPFRTAGQPTPVFQPRRTPTPASRLAPVDSAEGFVPRQITPTPPSQGLPVLPRIDPIPSAPGFRR